MRRDEHRALHGAIDEIRRGDVPGIFGGWRAVRVGSGGVKWAIVANGATTGAATLEEAVADRVVETLADMARRVWLERWEGIVRAGVALMFRASAGVVAGWLGVAVGDVRGEE